MKTSRSEKKRISLRSANRGVPTMGRKGKKVRSGGGTAPTRVERVGEVAEVRRSAALSKKREKLMKLWLLRRKVRALNTSGRVEWVQKGGAFFKRDEKKAGAALLRRWKKKKANNNNEGEEKGQRQTATEKEKTVKSTEPSGTRRRPASKQ